MNTDFSQTSRAFYGNTKGAVVYAIDIDQMKTLSVIPTGQGPYPVDKVSEDYLFAITRLEPSVTVIDLHTHAALRRVELPHRPRSAQGSTPTGFALISGGDRPQTSVVRLSDFAVISTAGISASGTIHDFGGQLASGHEQWIGGGAERFFLINRLHRTISVHTPAGDAPLWSVNTPTSVHHLRPDPAQAGRWFAMCEGNPIAKTPPSVLVIEAVGESFAVTAQRYLPIPTAQLGGMGSHHLDFHPGGVQLYIGSNEGETFVLSKATLDVLAVIPTGAGAGHTGFVEVGGKVLAISINHTAQHVSVIDTAALTLLTHIPVSEAPSAEGQRTQGHTSGARGKFFYMMASLDAAFVEIDLEKLEVTRRLCLPDDPSTGAQPFPMQGAFVWAIAAPSARDAGVSRVHGFTCTDCC